MVFRFLSINAQIDLSEVIAIKHGILFHGENREDNTYYIKFYTKHGSEIEFDYLFMEKHNGMLSCGRSGTSKDDVIACFAKVMKIHRKMNGMEV